MIRKALTLAMATTMAASQAIQDLAVPKECFGPSRNVYGPADPSGTPFSNQPQLAAGDYTLGMRLTGVKGCYTEVNQRFVGIRLSFSDALGNQLTLNDLGDVSGKGGAKCDTLELESSDFIEKVQIGWDGQGINSVSLIITRGVAQFGSVKISSEKVEFDGRAVMFAGFYGKTNLTGIKNLGVVAFRPEFCAGLMQEQAEALSGEEETVVDETIEEGETTNEETLPSEEDGLVDDQASEGEEDSTQVNVLIDDEQASSFASFFDFITDPDEIYAQFSAFTKPESQTGEDVEDSETVDTSEEKVTAQVDDVAPEEESSMIIPIIVGCVVVVLAIIACIVCSRLCRRKSEPIAAHKGKAKSEDDPEIGESDQNDLGDADHVIDDNVTSARSGAPDTARKLLDSKRRSEGMPETNMISVEEQHEEPDGSPNELAAAQRTAKGSNNHDDIETKSTPEVQHPAVSHTLETIDEMAGENTVQTSKHPSVVGGQQHQQHLAVQDAGKEGAEMPFVEEESSMAMINLAQNSAQKPQNEQASEAGLLPQISQNRAKNLFNDVTPDTKGVPKKRFQEIIDSDDETNGNGSKMLRMQNRKFKNNTDAFGDVLDNNSAGVRNETSQSKIDFPIKEGENEEVGELKSETRNVEPDQEQPSTNTASAKESSLAQKSDKSAAAQKKNSQRRTTQPKNGKKK